MKVLAMAIRRKKEFKLENKKLADKMILYTENPKDGTR